MLPCSVSRLVAVGRQVTQICQRFGNLDDLLEQRPMPHKTRNERAAPPRCGMREQHERANRSCPLGGF